MMPVQYKLIKIVANFSNIFRGVDRLSRNLFVVGFSVVAAPRHGNDHKLVVRNPYLIGRTTGENRAPASPDTGCVSLSTIFENGLRELFNLSIVFCHSPRSRSQN